MRTRIKIILWFVGGIFSLFLVGAIAIFGLLWWSANEMCGNQILATYNIDAADLKVVTFQRDCGATTGFSTQVSIIDIDEELPNKSGNIFIADTDHGSVPSGPGGGPEVRIKVSGSHQVELSHHVRARVFQAKDYFRKVNISYSTFGDRLPTTPPEKAEKSRPLPSN